VRLTNGSSLQTALAAADKFTYVAPAPGAGGTAPSVTSVSPASGVTTGGTTVTITGTGFTPDPAPVAGQPLPASSNTVVFGANAATNVNCSTATSCTVTSPAAAAGAVDVQVTTGGNTSPAVAGDKFTYAASAATLYAWGITAPKGGAVWLPDNNGGHWWSSDHAQGFCRQDVVPGVAPYGGTSVLHSLNFAACGDDVVGSAGQAVFDPRPIPGAANASLRYVYVPDNAVKSTAVWRLTFDPAGDGGNGAMVADPLGGSTGTAMVPLDNTLLTLKPNGMALGPVNADGSLPANAALYVTNLTESSVRKITNPNGDPRTQTVTTVAQTGDARGANGTAGFIGNLLYISENRGTAFFDVTQCTGASGPCGTVKIPLAANAAGIFIAGTAVDTTHKIVYSSDSPGGANATIYRYDASHDQYTAFPASATAGNANATCGSPGVALPCTVGAPGPILVTGGTLPTNNAPTAGNVVCALTCTRPFDLANHPGGPGSTAGFSFAFGLGVNPTNGDLIITEDPTAGNRSGRGSMWVVPFTP
jgi:hypothetical protein